MGGELTVRSTPGQGSTFSVRLYLREIAEPAPAALPTQPRHRPVSGYVGARRTLLVVDDQPVQRQMLAGLLAPLGFQLRESASGRECLDSVQAAAPDAILLDISMDGLDGWQTARLVRAAGFEQLPIIIVSADVFENRAENLEASRVQAFVAKPVIESELLDALQRTLTLEWTTDAPAPPSQAPAPPVALEAFGVPADALAELRALALAGRARVLRQRIDGLKSEHPSLAPLCDQWLRLVDAFDFDTLKEQLRIPDDTAT